MAILDLLSNKPGILASGPEIIMPPGDPPTPEQQAALEKAAEKFPDDWATLVNGPTESGDPYEGLSEDARREIEALDNRIATIDTMACRKCQGLFTWETTKGLETRFPLYCPLCGDKVESVNIWPERRAEFEG